MRMTGRRRRSAIAPLSLATALTLSATALAATQYQYDALGRLVRVRYDNGKEIAYTYDAAGNRLQRIVRTAGANRPPIANPDAVSLFENQTSVTFNPRLNDTDPDGNAISLYSAGSGSLGAAALSGAGATITYTSANRRGSGDSFVYVIRDTAGAEAYGAVTVTFANIAPVAVNDTVTTPRNAARHFDPRINDSDPGNDAITIIATSAPMRGSVTITGGGTGLIYTPAANQFGSDSFTYTIADSDGASAMATISMQVTHGQSAPTANADMQVTNLNQPLTFDPRENDSDPDGSTLTITARTNGTKGSVTINGGTSLTYTPQAGQSGADSFTYTIADADGQTATANVAMTIQASNRPPVANADSVELYGTYIPGGSATQPSGTIDPRWNDTDPDGNMLRITGVTQPLNGTASINAAGTTVTITRTAACPALTTSVGPVSYTISDGLGGTATGTITPVITCENISN
jgi:YD repeat-containing protein